MGAGRLVDGMTRPDKSSRWSQIEAIFDQAIELEEPGRSRYIENACAGDPALRQEVQKLLDAASSNGPLDTPLAQLTPGLADRASHELGGGAATAGRQVGAWTLVRELGRGGMGRVFLAERTDAQLNQTCALKLLRWELATQNLVDRFLAERQILARLEHANIARLIDGGVTDDGLPYLAMEYVEGLSIDDYCRSRNAPLQERLDLFLRVCDAVHFAHRNLVVHRDLKSSNILVTETGDTKLLDFGIAKILDDQPRELTQTTAAPATPHCAAPEQITGETVTTATDVWAMGILLYEMLADQRPFDGSLPAAELQKRIVESEPALPSSLLKGTRRKHLQGDLDTIVIKALRKAPADRYDSVERMANDIRRHQRGLPIEAQPATWSYHAGKFLRRHRVGVAVAAAVVVMVSSLVGFYTWRLAQERDQLQLQVEKTEQVTEFLQGIFATSDPRFSGGEDITARQLLEVGSESIDTELTEQPEVQGELHHVVGNLYDELGFYDKALEHFDKAVEKRRAVLSPNHVDLALSLSRQGNVLAAVNRMEEAEAALREALDIARKNPNDPAVIGHTMGELGLHLSYSGRYDEAEPLLREATDYQETIYGRESREYGTTLMNLGLNLKWGGDFDAAEEIYREVLGVRRRVLGTDDPDYASGLDNLGVLLGQRGDYEESEELFQEALATRRRVLGNEHPDVALSLNNLSSLYRVQNRIDESEPILREVLDLNRRLLGDRHRRVATNLSNLAGILVARGKLDEAIGLFNQAEEIREESLGSEHIEVALVKNSLANAYLQKGELNTADDYSQQSIAIARAAVGPESFQLAQNLRTRGIILLSLERAEEAKPVLDEAVRIQTVALREGHWETAMSRAAVGACLAAARKFDEAEPLLTEGYAAVSEARGVDAWLSRFLAQQVVSMYENWGKPNEAAKYRGHS